MQNYLFVSDTHFGDDRIGINGKLDLLYRGSTFKSVKDMDKTLIENIRKKLNRNDILVHLGDVTLYDENRFDYLNEMFESLKCQKKILIKGNYDKPFVNEFFDEVYDEFIIKIKDIGNVYLNHYPIQCVPMSKLGMLTLTGHIHSLFKIQPNMINVGVDAWSYHPVSTKEICLLYNAMKNIFDQNCFPFIDEFKLIQNPNC